MITLVMNRKAVLKALNFVSKVAEANTVPILSFVDLKWGEGISGIRFTCNNLDIECFDTVYGCTYNMDGGEPNGIAVEAKTLIRILKICDSETVSMVVDETIGNGVRKYRVFDGQDVYGSITLPHEDFPFMSMLQEWSTFVGSAPDFFDDFAALEPFISQEEVRYYLNGVHMRIVDGKMHLAATDGHKLMRLVRNAPEDFDAPDRIISRRVIKLLPAMRKEMEALNSVVMQVDRQAQKMIIRYGTRVIMAKTIDGTFPDYTRVIPEMKSSIEVSGPRLNAIARKFREVFKGSRDVSNSIKFVGHAGVLSATSMTPEGLLATANMSYHSFNHVLEGQFVIGINQKYLDVVTKRMDGVVTIGVCPGEDPMSSPILFRTRDERQTIVLMPMRV